jgi:prolyl-tRNA synthetase
MKKESKEGINIKRDENFPEWYNEIILKADIAEYSTIKGFMIIKPYGYALWEKIQDYFNPVIKKIGVKNAYFPLLIPESFFKKEAQHAEGFSPEVAWIANKDDDTEERLAIRPTSETIIYDAFSRWIRSHRDLPVKVNQWCNVVRWETKSTKLFLRTREFLWQEGHCSFAKNEEADENMYNILDEYQKLSENLLAIPVIKGTKTEAEKFAGANTTTTIEGLMPDGKALQMGTSHNLGQNFSKAFNIKYSGEDEKEHLTYQTSWGISTRLIGGLIMTHSDEKGLILPPKIAPIHIAIVPIIFEDSKLQVIKKCKEIKSLLSDYEVELDLRNYSPGWKFNQWELKGVPIRLEVGPRDLENDQVVVVRRDTSEKTPIKVSRLNDTVKEILEDMQTSLFEKAKKFLEESKVSVNNLKDLEKQVKNKKIVKVPFCCGVKCEDSIREKIEGISSRCIPLEEKEKPKENCINCENKAKNYVYFSKAY